jgi:phosphoribosylglycinamide formyltransferase-1
MNVAIFASGSGTNAENIIQYFAKTTKINISLVVCNKPDAYVLQRAKKQNINTIVVNRKDFYESTRLLNAFQEHNIKFIVLAGFLWLLPEYILNHFENAVLNIHPALLPKYGGKGMYGMNVHKAVVENKESETGITIHYCNEKYDEGSIVYQAKCAVETNDTPEMVANKVHKLEYEHFPKIIEQEIERLTNS